MMMLVVILLQVLDGLKDNSTIKQLDIRLTGVAKKVVKIWQQISQKLFKLTFWAKTKVKEKAASSNKNDIAY